MGKEPTYSDLEKGKVYDIQVFDGIPGRIGKVIDKEKAKKDQPASVLVEFTRSPVIYIKGIETKVSPKYTIWLDGDYPIYSYRELSHITISEETRKDLAPQE